MPGFLRQAEDASRISCEIPYRGIELRERYFHAGTLEYGCTREIANSVVTHCVEIHGLLALTIFA